MRVDDLVIPRESSKVAPGALASSGQKPKLECCVCFQANLRVSGQLLERPKQSLLLGLLAGSPPGPSPPPARMPSSQLRRVGAWVAPACRIPPCVHQLLLQPPSGQDARVATGSLFFGD